MKSSKKETRCDLAGSSSSQKAKDFLVGLANLRDDKDGLRWLRSKFPDVLEAVSRTVGAIYSTPPRAVLPGTPEHDESNRKLWLIPLRDTLRAIWRAPDTKTKQWGLFRISQDFFLQGDPNTIHRPGGQGGSDFLLSWKPPTQTERFLLALMGWADLLQYCDNEECPAPYFIAKKRTQKYCSHECAKPAQRESKLRWWTQKGRQRRSAKRKR
jgi:hypothetical protein